MPNLSILTNLGTLIIGYILIAAGGCFILLWILDYLSRKFGVFKNGIFHSILLGEVRNIQTKGVVVSFDASKNAYLIDNKPGRAVAIINLIVGVILGFMLLVIGSLVKDHPFLALTVIFVCLLIVLWRIHLVFRHLP